ncbi:hypothetical protein RZN05_02330 [Sphingomonas sp. HF-S4]|uniref:Uncharacterized protein n=1 Tax=Sphingomonas agrestis TaxID=3080540 RepID=A0ABU3Y344_9SPHN|nr:hypothetical protein [Sphingomonas sp. HF-S4]MDV3455806.1 hypothetical protein [Sphingomonas sp. HF-S4]
MLRIWPDPRDSKPDSKWAVGAIVALIGLGMAIQLYAWIAPLFR